MGLFDQESNVNLLKNYNNSMIFNDNMNLFNSNHLNTMFVMRNLEDTMMIKKDSYNNNLNNAQFNQNMNIEKEKEINEAATPNLNPNDQNNNNHKTSTLQQENEQNPTLLIGNKTKRSNFKSKEKQKEKEDEDNEEKKSVGKSLTKSGSKSVNETKSRNKKTKKKSSPIKLEEVLRQCENETIRENKKSGVNKSCKSKSISTIGVNGENCNRNSNYTVDNNFNHLNMGNINNNNLIHNNNLVHNNNLINSNNLINNNLMNPNFNNNLINPNLINPNFNIFNKPFNKGEIYYNIPNNNLLPPNQINQMSLYNKQHYFSPSPGQIYKYPQNINISNSNPYIINQNNYFNNYAPPGGIVPQTHQNIDIPHPNSFMTTGNLSNLANLKDTQVNYSINPNVMNQGLVWNRQMNNFRQMPGNFYYNIPRPEFYDQEYNKEYNREFNPEYNKEFNKEFNIKPK